MAKCCSCLGKLDKEANIYYGCVCNIKEKRALTCELIDEAEQTKDITLNNKTCIVQ